jgi:hypothetical protein
MTDFREDLCETVRCGRRAGHRGCHTPNPPLLTVDWDHNYEAIVVRLVMRAIRMGRLEADPPYIDRWLAREAALR